MTTQLVPIRDLVRPIESANPQALPDSPFTYIDIASIDNLLKVITAPQRLLGREAPSRARQRIRSGDILVATTRPYLNAVGQIAATECGAADNLRHALIAVQAQWLEPVCKVSHTTLFCPRLHTCRYLVGHTAIHA